MDANYWHLNVFGMTAKESKGESHVGEMVVGCSREKGRRAYGPELKFLQDWLSSEEMLDR